MARKAKRQNQGRTSNDDWWSRPSRLGPVGRMTVAERIADHLRRGILLGELKPGKRLESCRAMARDTRVGVSVIREAIAQLRGEGLVRVRHGVGVFVVAPPRKARAIRAARRSANRRELFELRGALEPIVAEAAAHRRTEAAQLELRLLLGERDLTRRSGNARAFGEADVAFHRAIFRMSGNRLAATGAALAGPALIGHLGTNAEVIASDDGLQSLHTQLADAIEARRPTVARRAAVSIATREGCRV